MGYTKHDAGVASVIAAFAAAQDAELEAAVMALGVDPSELHLTDGYVDGVYQVEARHVPSDTAVTVRGADGPQFREWTDEGGQLHVSASVENLRADAIRQLKTAMGARADDGQH